MFYYYRKNNDNNMIEIVGNIGREDLIPDGCSICNEAEYNIYLEQISTQRYGTIQEREYKKVLDDIRGLRKIVFMAFDIYKTNIFYGIMQESQEEKDAIINWYNTWLNFPETITIENYMNVTYPETPYVISQYL